MLLKYAKALSCSAATAKLTPKQPFLATIQQLACNKPFLIIFLFLGGAMGYVSTLQTKLEQILCSRGYSDVLAGVGAALIIFSGFLASFPIGFVSMKTGRLILISKSACLPAIAALVGSTWVLVQEQKAPLVVVTCIALGIFSLGIYPVMLELSVECTFPLDESVVTGLCYLSSAIQGSVLMLVENFFDWPLSEREKSVQTCNHGGDGGLEAKNFTSYLVFINAYMICLILLFLVFFNTDFKRSQVFILSFYQRQQILPLSTAQDIFDWINNDSEINRLPRTFTTIFFILMKGLCIIARSRKQNKTSLSLIVFIFQENEEGFCKVPTLAPPPPPPALVETAGSSNMEENVKTNNLVYCMEI